MTRGGARNRSGPGKDPNSLRSAAAGYVLTALPSEGYAGEVPDFPLMEFTVLRWETEDKRRYQVRDDEATEAFRRRELELWEQAWTYPQACAWAQESWRWNTVAMWVRTQVVCESSGGDAADKARSTASRPDRDDAGRLKENGWAIARNEIADKAAEKQTEAAQVPQSSARDRMTVVNGGGEG